MNVDESGHATGGGYVRWQGMPYTKWRLFGLSMLWRASVSSVRPFVDADLGEHENALRDALRKDDPGPRWFFPFLNYLVVLDRRVCKEIVAGPRETKWDGILAYEMIIGGVGWIFLIDDNLRNDIVEGGTIDPQGNLLMRVTHPFHELEWLRHSMEEVFGIRGDGDRDGDTESDQK